MKVGAGWHQRSPPPKGDVNILTGRRQTVYVGSHMSRQTASRSHTEGVAQQIAVASVVSG